MPKLISNIEITRGDTCYVARQLFDEEDNILILNPVTDTVNFTVRKNMESEAVIHKDLSDGITIKDDGVIEIIISPTDTQDLDFGEYGFDIEVTIGKDEEIPFVKTVNSGKFILTDDDYSRPIKVGE